MKPVEQKLVRCAIYTRKSTEDGLQKEYNSLEAQRDSAENYVRSQQGEGWIILPKHYDDGGFTGGNMERPALKELLSDVEHGLVDIILVYKVDRLSRSLLDFATLISTFDKFNVSFVSVTQSFSTASSMGRLTLNILLSFAQFEREIIGERVRDKVAAARRKGKQTGGTPVLGYDFQNTKLVVNPEEAKTVRHIFRRFLVLGSPLFLTKELNDQGIHTKSWTTRKGKVRTGGRWSKNALRYLLTNRKYLGEVPFQGQIYPGEHEAIVDRKIWEQAQTLFQQDKSKTGRDRTPAMLKGLLRCGHCGSSMGITYTKKNGRTYRYYQCLSASKNGYDTCPVKTVPAGEIESAVVGQMRDLLRAPETVAKAHLALAGEEDPVDSKEFAAALQDVDAVWDSLFPAEQMRLCRLLINQVVVNTNGLHVRLHNCGIRTLLSEMKGTDHAC